MNYEKIIEIQLLTQPDPPTQLIDVLKMAQARKNVIASEMEEFRVKKSDSEAQLPEARQLLTVADPQLEDAQRHLENLERRVGYMSYSEKQAIQGELAERKHDFKAKKKLRFEAALNQKNLLESIENNSMKLYSWEGKLKQICSRIGVMEQKMEEMGEHVSFKAAFQIEDTSSKMVLASSTSYDVAAKRLRLDEQSTPVCFCAPDGKPLHVLISIIENCIQASARLLHEDYVIGTGTLRGGVQDGPWWPLPEGRPISARRLTVEIRADQEPIPDVVDEILRLLSECEVEELTLQPEEQRNHSAQRQVVLPWDLGTMSCKLIKELKCTRLTLVKSVFGPRLTDQELTFPDLREYRTLGTTVMATRTSRFFDLNRLETMEIDIHPLLLSPEVFTAKWKEGRGEIDQFIFNCPIFFEANECIETREVDSETLRICYYPYAHQVIVDCIKQ